TKVKYLMRREGGFVVLVHEGIHQMLLNAEDVV
ncbi:unnamed protein product, partial [marine sediment metagenome]